MTVWPSEVAICDRLAPISGSSSMMQMRLAGEIAFCLREEARKLGLRHAENGRPVGLREAFHRGQEQGAAGKQRATRTFVEGFVEGAEQGDAGDLVRRAGKQVFQHLLHGQITSRGRACYRPAIPPQIGQLMLDRVRSFQVRPRCPRIALCTKFRHTATCGLARVLSCTLQFAASGTVSPSTNERAAFRACRAGA